jgi:hypothetical protein
LGLVAIPTIGYRPVPCRDCHVTPEEHPGAPGQWCIFFRHHPRMCHRERQRCSCLVAISSRGYRLVLRWGTAALRAEPQALMYARQREELSGNFKAGVGRFQQGLFLCYNSGGTLCSEIPEDASVVLRRSVRRRGTVRYCPPSSSRSELVFYRPFPTG